MNLCYDDDEKHVNKKRGYYGSLKKNSVAAHDFFLKQHACQLLTDKHAVFHDSLKSAYLLTT